MTKGRNLIETETITISTTAIIKKQLAQLVHTGYWGKNEAEAGERIIAQWLTQMTDAGKIKPPAD